MHEIRNEFSPNLIKKKESMTSSGYLLPFGNPSTFNAKLLKTTRVLYYCWP